MVGSGYQQVAHLAMAVTCEFRREERLWITARSGLALVRKHWIDSKHDREQADLLDTSCLPSIALAIPDVSFLPRLSLCSTAMSSWVCSTQQHGCLLSFFEELPSVLKAPSHSSVRSSVIGPTGAGLHLQESKVCSCSDLWPI